MEGKIINSCSIGLTGRKEDFMYTIFDNVGNKHKLEAGSDTEALEIMKTKYIDYIYSVLRSDSIIIARPNGYILAYINTATGEQTVKTMEDWGA